jgi:hypothetical protein
MNIGARTHIYSVVVCFYQVTFYFASYVFFCIDVVGAAIKSIGAIAPNCALKGPRAGVIYSLLFNYAQQHTGSFTETQQHTGGFTETQQPHERP